MLKLPERLGNMVIGYQDIFEDMSRLGHTDMPTFPPYDMIKLDNGNEYRIDIAVAGYKEDEIEITNNDRKLVIAGHKKEIETSETAEYVYRGIARRSFQREFMLGPHLKIKEATIDNGILSIHLYKEIPEELKPKRIPISRI